MVTCSAPQAETVAWMPDRFLATVAGRSISTFRPTETGGWPKILQFLTFAVSAGQGVFRGLSGLFWPVPVQRQLIFLDVNGAQVHVAGDEQGVVMTVAAVTGAAGVNGTPSGAAGPATWLGGRFRLDEPISTGSGLAWWKATDGLLRRPVTVYLLPRGREVPRYVVEAVQAAARVSDPRLAAIYDTDYDLDCPYVVSEWAPGTHLEDLLLSGLPSPALAAAMIADAADALAVAHEAGRPHLCLSPRSLRWDNASGLKITGLGIDAALSGASADDPGAADAAALAQMLYALLTGFWPGEEATAIPPAPRHGGHVYSPRQVRAGVPGRLDEITRHALQIRPLGAPRSALTPAGLAMALRSVQRPSCQAFESADPGSCAPITALGAWPGRRARHGRARNRTTLRPAM